MSNINAYIFSIAKYAFLVGALFLSHAACEGNGSIPHAIICAALFLCFALLTINEKNNPLIK